MSPIVIHRSHSLTLDQARQAVEALAGQLALRHGIGYHWQGNSLHFERPGMSGDIDLEPGLIRVNARLGLLLAPFQHKLEQEIHRHLDEILQPSASSA